MLTKYLTTSAVFNPESGGLRLKAIKFVNVNGALQLVSAYIGTNNTGSKIFRDGINSQRSSTCECFDIDIASLYVELGPDCSALVIYE